MHSTSLLDKFRKKGRKRYLYFDLSSEHAYLSNFSSCYTLLVRNVFNPSVAKIMPTDSRNRNLLVSLFLNGNQFDSYYFKNE